MEDFVVANRMLTHRDLALWTLIVQLTPEEIEETIDLIRDLIADRGRSDVMTPLRPEQPDRRQPIVAD